LKNKNFEQGFCGAPFMQREKTKGTLERARRHSIRVGSKVRFGSKADMRSAQADVR
jgi:hypothetical protein